MSFTLDSSSSGIVSGQDPQFVAVETYTSRTASLLEGREQRSRSFTVYSNTEPPQPLPDTVTAVNLTGVQYGDPHPENADLLAVDVISNISDLAGRAVYLVTWTYRAVSFGGIIGGVPQNPEAPDYQEFNLTTDPTLIDVWRAPIYDPAFLPADGNISNGYSDGDIGGVPVDAAGITTSVLVRRGTLEITRNVPLNEFDAQPLLELAGGRNAFAFLGFPPGKMLYLGARSTRVSQGVVRVTHEFGYDEFAHLQQIPDTDEDGNFNLSEPNVTTIRTLDADGNSVDLTYPNRHAYLVRWFQPFPRIFDFGILGAVV